MCQKYRCSELMRILGYVRSLGFDLCTRAGAIVVRIKLKEGREEDVSPAALTTGFSDQSVFSRGAVGDVYAGFADQSMGLLRVATAGSTGAVELTVPFTLEPSAGVGIASSV